MTTQRTIITLTLALCCALSACGKKTEPAAEPTPAQSATAAAEASPKAAPAEKAPAAAEEEGTKPEPPANLLPEPSAALLNPEGATESAPDQYKVKLETTQGDIIIEVTKSWAPKGADRFYNLVKVGFYDDVAFFRVIGGFMAQVGLHGHPKVNAKWRTARIDDDPVKQSNTRGMVSFATAGPNTRTTQFFVNFADNNRLDGMGFAPFGVIRDMSVVDKLHAGYGEGAPRGMGPAQGRVQTEGNSYLRKDFPKLDYIKKASIL